MRRKAKELQQARRDAERSGKKAPAFGGFGSAGMTGISSGSIITDTIVEPEKPKISPAPVRYASTHPSHTHTALYHLLLPHEVSERSPLQAQWTQ